VRSSQQRFPPPPSFERSLLVRRFYDENLAQESYMMRAKRTRKAIVVDPNSDQAQYLRAAGDVRVGDSRT